MLLLAHMYKPKHPCLWSRYYSTWISITLMNTNYLHFGSVGWTYVDGYESYGPGTGSVWMLGPKCDGTERTILDCINNPTLSTDTHHHDVGIICQSEWQRKVLSSNSSQHNKLEWYAKVCICTSEIPYDQTVFLKQTIVLK